MNILRKREKGTVGTGTEKPPPLVRRCNGTIAGLGYLEVGLDCHLIIPPGSGSVPAISSCRMWTVYMINCLRNDSF